MEKAMKYIPVLVDKILKRKRVPLVRCTYFIVESDSPDPDWEIVYQNKRLPVFLLGLSGIIYKPLGRKRYFDTRLSVQQLFHGIEGYESLILELDELWIPQFFFEDLTVERGQVYRIREDLFTQAYYYRTGRISEEEFFNRIERDLMSIRTEKGMPDTQNLIWFSGKETKAFVEWENVVIEEARTIYRIRKEEQKELK